GDLAQGDEAHVEWLVSCAPDANVYPVDAAVGPTYFEMRVADGRINSQEALGQGIANLYRYFNPVLTLSWNTRDITMLPGRSVTVNASAGVVANTYLHQSVTIQREMLPPRTIVFPMRTVEASSVRETFAAIMRRLRGTQ